MRERHTFPNEPESVTAARNFVRRALEGVPTDMAQTVELMVSELATNCVRHTDGNFEISVEQDAEEIRVEAVDSGGGKPQLRSPGPSDPHGRGLLIVDALADAWGVDVARGQKFVWFTVPVPTRPEPRLTGCR